jgi:transcriptional regulator with XRE-family HTH domain
MMMEVIAMNYQIAFDTLLNMKNRCVEELAEETGFTVRWLRSVRKDSSWVPHLDTLFILCKALSVDVLEFLCYAEEGQRAKRVTHTHTHTALQGISPYQVACALRTIRLEKNLSQSRLAALTQFQISSISYRESTRYVSYPTLAVLEIYCKAFGIGLGEFLCRAAEQKGRPGYALS